MVLERKNGPRANPYVLGAGPSRRTRPLGPNGVPTTSGRGPAAYPVKDRTPEAYTRRDALVEVCSQGEYGPHKTDPRMTRMQPLSPS